MDTCEMCGTCADCRIENGRLVCAECEGKCDGLDVSDTAWRIASWLYPDSLAERVDYVMMKMAQEVQYG